MRLCAVPGAARGRRPLLLGAVLLAACMQPLAPQDVAERFWEAVAAGEPARIRRYVVAADRELLSGDVELLPVAGYELGRVVIDGDRATVETHVTLAGDTPLEIEIDTALVREGGAWRVDYRDTAERISAQGDLARVMKRIGEIGDALQRGIDRSVDDMQRALPALERELARIEREIRQRVPELRDKLEQYSKRLEESLKPPPEPPSPRDQTAPDGAIAL